MTILYPIDKPVTIEDVRNRAEDLLAQAGEWTRWEGAVLAAVRDNAGRIHDHYMHHVWYEVEGLGDPDPQSARDEVMACAEAMLETVAEEDAAEALILTGGGTDAHDALAALLMHAASMVDDLMEGLRRGPGAIRDGQAHDVAVTDWLDLARYDDGDIAPVASVTARTRLTDGIRSIAALAQAGEDETATVGEVLARRSSHSADRNAERIDRVVDLANQYYALPEGYRLTVEERREDAVVVAWGSPELSLGSLRPHGRDHIQLEINALGEIRPRAIADVARSGRLACLTLGRDAEIRAQGHELGSPPIWAWAGPLPLVRGTLARLAAGEDIDVTSDGMTAGPLLGVAGMDLGDGSTTYSYNARTLDEWVSISDKVDDGFAHRCIGNPVTVIVQSPILDDPSVTIARCDPGDEGTEFELTSPLMRLQTPPAGVVAEPDAAWRSMMDGFDDEAVYGPRPLASMDT